MRLKTFENFKGSSIFSDYNVVMDWYRTPEQVKGAINSMGGTLVMLSQIESPNDLDSILDETPVIFIEYERATAMVQSKVDSLSPTIIHGANIDPVDVIGAPDISSY